MIQDYVQYNPSKIIFGHGAEEKTAQEIKRLGGTRVLLHYDAGAFIKPLIARIRTQMEAAGLYVVELGGAQSADFADEGRLPHSAGGQAGFRAGCGWWIHHGQRQVYCLRRVL